MSERIKALIGKYPELFKDNGPRCGFHVGEGWMTLVEKLTATIDRERLRAPEDIRDEIYVVQIKSKFAGLRYYINQGTSYINGAIALAESMSYSICETCGNPAKLRNESWAVTLCDECYKEKI